MDEVFCYAGDIAGYKNILLSLPPGEQRSRIDEFRKLTHNAASKYEFQDSYIILSDTIFVIAENSKDGLERLLKFSSHILETGIKKALPIRGAIDFGPAEIDLRINSVCGKAAAHAYTLAEEQDWIGTCCAEDSPDNSDRQDNPRKARLPFITELWDFDLVFVYPVPLKNGKILFRPTVSWKVPPYMDFRASTIEKGLVSDKDMDWKYATKVQNTIIFSQYLNAIRYGSIAGKPDSFPGDLAIRFLNDIIEDHHEENRYLRGGWSIIKMPERQKILIPAKSKEELISVLKDIL